VNPSTLAGRRGFDLDAPWRTYQANAHGQVVVHGEELDRFELAVGAARGYLRTPGGLRPLPIGSRLEAATGVFTWQPGVGFVGAYEFVFVGEASRRDVRIVLHPRGSTRVGPQVVIDTPGAGAVTAAPFVIAGWAADLDDEVETGVDAVHVWAYPVSTTCADGQAVCHDAPIFLGAATGGGRRPDVAAVYGARYLRSGYGLWVRDLAPGTYDLAVFAWSTVQGGFAPARTVRVEVP
jgi:hypothetical protein